MGYNWLFDVEKYDYIKSRECVEKNDVDKINALRKRGYNGIASKYNALKCTLDYYRVCADNLLNGTLSDRTREYLEKQESFL